MMIKFFPHGTGDPYRAVNYLLSIKDNNGQVRPEVKVLRGNPHMLASLVASLSTVHRYTSAVIAWAHTDKPTPKEVNDVLDDFERLSFAGLDPDRYCFAAVSHGDHVHILVARLDLKTGKALNIAPPLWRKHFDYLRDTWNYRIGWARPDDPARARLVQADGGRSMRYISELTKAERISNEMGFSVSDVLDANGVKPTLKQIIGDQLLFMVHEGTVKNREDVIAVLLEYGVVHRQGKDYLSIKPFGGGTPIRFKGVLFHQEFDALKHFAQYGDSTGLVKCEPNLVAAKVAQTKLDAAIARRVNYNQMHYPEPKPGQFHQPTSQEDEKPVTYSVQKEVEDERNRNDVVEKTRRSLQFAREGFASFVRACIEAVRRLGSAELASDKAQRACDDAERASRLSEQAGRKLHTGIGDLKTRQAGKMTRPRRE